MQNCKHICKLREWTHLVYVKKQEKEEFCEVLSTLETALMKALTGEGGARRLVVRLDRVSRRKIYFNKIAIYKEGKVVTVTKRRVYCVQERILLSAESSRTESPKQLVSRALHSASQTSLASSEGVEHEPTGRAPGHGDTVASCIV